MMKIISILKAGIFLIVLLNLATMTVAASGRTFTVANPELKPNPVQSPLRGACQLKEYNGSYGSHISDIRSGDKIVQYFDPADCGATPNYPFGITSFEFSLYDDDYEDFQWPCQLDIIVYDTANPTGECAEPGDELCRFTIICDSLIFCFPKVGTATFQDPCCVDAPFFIGIEYTGASAIYPSPFFDDNPAPVSCHLYGYDSPQPEYWTEWYEFCGEEVAGYPAWWVNGETKSPFCGSGSIWWKEPEGIYLPDFDQNQSDWSSYSGPVATANCLWWFNERFPDWGLVPEDMEAPEFIESLAALMSTNIEPLEGTNADSLKSGVDQWLEQRGLSQTLNVSKIDQPTYDYCRGQLLECENVILQLGFWYADSIKYETPTIDCFETYWSKIDSQYITMAGVNPVGNAVGISDPDKDRAETILPRPPSRIMGTNHSHPEGHNDGLSASHDVYDVSELAISPGGLWKLPKYGSYPDLIINEESGRPIYDSDPLRNGSAVTVWCDEEPGWFHAGVTVAEIEAAIIINPVRTPVLGRTRHNIDSYDPDLGDPTGTGWLELWPQYNDSWELSGWNDNGDGFLSFSDTVNLTFGSSEWVSREQVEWVGPTMTLSDLDNPSLIVILEEIDPNPMVNNIINPVGTNWYEVYPDHDQIWEITYWIDNGDGYLNHWDRVQITKIDGPEASFYNIDAIETDIVSTPLIVSGDEFDHNTDGYLPADGDPTGTVWHELWPHYCDNWNLVEWRDNSDGKLSYGDSIKFSGQALPDSIIWKLVEKVTPTIILSDGLDTYFLDFMDHNPDILSCTDPVGTYWFEVYPEHSTRWLCQEWTDNGNGYLDIGDDIDLMAMDGIDSGAVIAFQVDGWQTDIISTYIYPYPPSPIEGDINLHNNDGYKPPNGDPVDTHWDELWPQYEQDWTLSNWFDIDKNNRLSLDDYIDVINDNTLAWKKYHVSWVGPTITATFDETTIYLEYMGSDNPNIDPIVDPGGTYWHELYPDHSQIFMLLYWTDNGNGYLDNDDMIVIRNVLTNQDLSVSLESIATDVILTEITTEPTNPLPDGTLMHNTDMPHYYPNEDPTGSVWQEFYPFQNWSVTGWFDEGDGNLSINDFLDFYNPVSEAWKKLNVDWVGPTIRVSLGPNTIYLDYVGFDKADMSAITDVIGMYWQEAYPNKGKYYYCVGWIDEGGGILNYNDNLILQDMTTGQSATYHVDDLTTDLILSEIDMPETVPGINLHNRDSWTPLDGDPVGTNWHELYPEFCQDWLFTGWTDNSDGRLSVGDRATFNGLETPEYDIVWQGPTIKISLDEDTLYLDYTAADNPDMAPITDPVGIFWHEVAPVYCQYYFCTNWVDEGDGYLGGGDYIVLQDIPIGSSNEYIVHEIQTDLIISEVQACDCVPGEVDQEPSMNILDIVYLINSIYKSGPPPAPYALCSGDPNHDCSLNILDIVYLINFIYKNGPEPCSCEDWVAACGPLRK